MTRADFVVLAAMSAVLMFSGCDQETQDTLQEQADRAQERAAETWETGREKAEELGAEAQRAWEDAKEQWQPQVDALVSDVESLRQRAAQFKDEELDGYIQQLDAKLGQIRDTLKQAFSEEGFASAREKMDEWVADAKRLYERAKQRLAELGDGGGAPDQ